MICQTLEIELPSMATNDFGAQTCRSLKEF